MGLLGKTEKSGHLKRKRETIVLGIFFGMGYFRWWCGATRCEVYNWLTPIILGGDLDLRVADFTRLFGF